MKPVERKRLARAIRELVPDLYEKGTLLAATPRNRVLRGFYLEGSHADPSGVYIWAFVQPLYVLESTIVLSLGSRLGGGSKTWRVDETEEAAAAARDNGVPFFGPMSSPHALAEWSFLDGRSDEYAREVKACSLVASGRLHEGAHALRELAGALTGGTPWMIETQQRANQLADLAETGATAAHELLATWESATVSALGVQAVP